MITTVAQADGHLFGWRARPTGRDTHKYTNTTNAKWLLLFCFCGFKIVWKHNTQHIRRVVLHCGQNMHRHLYCKCGSSHFMVVYILLNLKWIFFWLLSPFRSASYRGCKMCSHFQCEQYLSICKSGCKCNAGESFEINLWLLVFCVWTQITS